MKRLLALFLVLALLLPGAAFAASINDPLWDWKYDAIERLISAYGEPDTALGNTRPISRAEMARLFLSVEEKVKVSSTPVHWYHGVLMQRLRIDLARELAALSTMWAERQDPLRWVRFTAGRRDQPALKPNDSGLRTNRATGMVEFASSFEDEHYALQVRPRIVAREAAGTSLGVESATLIGQWDNTVIDIGRENMWWGPGRDGAAVLSSNAAAFDRIRISSHSPFVLPYLGNMRAVFFFGQIGPQPMYARTGTSKSFSEDYWTAQPLISGYRLDFAPFSFMELGISHAMIATRRLSENYPVDGLTELIIPNWTRNESSWYQGMISDHIQALDLSLTFGREYAFVDSLGLSSFRIYVEYGGEAVWVTNYYWPWLQYPLVIYGMYGDWGPVDLRIEFANSSSKIKWYAHNQFLSGYANDGAVMGHYMGGYAKNLSVMASWAATAQIKPSLKFQWKERFMDEASNTYAGTAALEYWYSDKSSVEGSAEYSRYTPQGGAGVSDAAVFVNVVNRF